MSTARKVILGYLLIAIAGTLLLAIPAFHQKAIGWTDHLFTSVSTLSTTGLDSIGVGQAYNTGGQLIMLLLMQIGGIGYMSVAAFWLMAIHKKWGSGETEMIKADLGLPMHYNFIDIIKVKIIIALIVETVGAIVLYFLFRNAEVPGALWSAVFHSVSAFCTVGITLFPDELELFINNKGVMLILIVLSYIGSIGFIVFTDLWQKLRNKRKQLSFTSRVILRTTSIGVFGGTIILYLIEPTFHNMSWGEGWMMALFHNVSAGSTMGFNTVPLNSLLTGSIFILIIFMMIGSSPTGTGGGIKVTSFSIAIAQVRSTFSRRKEVVLEKTSIPDFKVRLALSSFVSYLLMLFLSIGILSILESEVELEGIFFECTSALSNVGLSLGLTPTFKVESKLLLSIVMFIGRIGVLSLGLAFLSDVAPSEKGPSHDIAV